MKIKPPIIKLIMSCLCLGSTYAIASPPLPDNSKIQTSNISEKILGTILSLQEQNTDL